jgi:putative hydrolase of the HAD superfamily
MAIKAVIFDADELIIKRKEYFSAKLSREHNIPEEKIMPFFKGEFQECVVGTADLKEAVQPYLKDWNWDGTVEDLLKYWFEAEREIDSRVVEQINNLKAKGVKCYLATNQEKYRTEYLRKNLGFENIFDGIYSSCEMGYKKPDQKFFEYINDDLKRKEDLNPGEIMFWDNEEANVAAAKGVGWEGHLYDGFDDFQKVISRI